MDITLAADAVNTYEMICRKERKNENENNFSKTSQKI